MTLVLLPDSEAIAVNYLATQTDMVAIVGARTYADPPENVVWPYANVVRVGGRPEPGDPGARIDHAHLQLAGWSEDRGQAFDICATMVAALHKIPQIQARGIVTAVQDILGPRPLPDQPTNRPRFIAEVLVTTHPLP